MRARDDASEDDHDAPRGGGGRRRRGEFYFFRLQTCVLRAVCLRVDVALLLRFLFSTCAFFVGQLGPYGNNTFKRGQMAHRATSAIFWLQNAVSKLLQLATAGSCVPD